MSKESARKKRRRKEKRRAEAASKSDLDNGKTPPSTDMKSPFPMIRGKSDRVILDDNFEGALKYIDDNYSAIEPNGNKYKKLKNFIENPGLSSKYYDENGNPRISQDLYGVLQIIGEGEPEEK